MSEMQAIALDGKFYPVKNDELVWRPSVYGVVIDGGDILLSPQHGIGYDLPGGGMEFGEDFEDTVIREVKEETGIDVKILEFLGMQTSLFVWKPDDPNKRKSMQSILIYYLCENIGGQLSIDGFDEDEKNYAQLAEWVELEKIETLKFASSVDILPIIKNGIRAVHGN